MLTQLTTCCFCQTGVVAGYQKKGRGQPTTTYITVEEQHNTMALATLKNEVQNSGEQRVLVYLHQPPLLLQVVITDRGRWQG